VTTSIEISEQVAVSEPAMPAVLGLGMLMLARLRRRR
jgi:MYXO-CTERM domain-containing protein